MLFQLLVLFTAVPFVELLLLIWINKHLGLPATVVLVLLTGIAGAWLARWEGLRTLQQIKRDLSLGKPPGEVLIQGAMILVAGVLLITPGVLTDAVGLCVLIPPTRRWFAHHLMRYLHRRINITHVDLEAPPKPRRRVDARVTRVEPDKDH